MPTLKLQFIVKFFKKETLLTQISVNYFSQFYRTFLKTLNFSQCNKQKVSSRKLEVSEYVKENNKV